MAIRERLSKAFNEKNAVQRFLARKYLFSLFQWAGIHITGDHFYEIIPNTNRVAREYLEEARQLHGIDLRFEQCEARGLGLLTTYGSEFTEWSAKFGFREKNWYFRGMDALFLYCVLRELKPAKMVEIGQGFSTRIALAALERNALETGMSPLLVSVDPYPRITTMDVPASMSLELVRQAAQRLELPPLLRDCGFLFVDSSHVYKFGSDVAFEFTDIYPRLPTNTLFHVHDIFSPYEYPKEWIVKDKLFWNEQYFLECFLMFNAEFEINLPVHLLARKSEKIMGTIRKLALDPDFQFWGSSFYLMRRAAPALSKDAS